jgi:hypothetical protein
MDSGFWYPGAGTELAMNSAASAASRGVRPPKCPHRSPSDFRGYLRSRHWPRVFYFSVVGSKERPTRLTRLGLPYSSHRSHSLLLVSERFSNTQRGLMGSDSRQS